MTRLYIIFAVTGWAWALIVFAYLFIRWQWERPRPAQRGFEVLNIDEKHR